MLTPFLEFPSLCRNKINSKLLVALRKMKAFSSVLLIKFTMKFFSFLYDVIVTPKRVNLGTFFDEDWMKKLGKLFTF